MKDNNQSSTMLTLINAAKNHNYDACEKLINERCNLREVDESGMTAMMYLAQDKSWQSLPVIDLISKTDRDVIYMKDNDGRTALIHSIINNSPASLKILQISTGGISFDREIDYITEKDNFGKSAIDYCVIWIIEQDSLMENIEQDSLMEKIEKDSLAKKAEQDFLAKKTEEDSLSKKAEEDFLAKKAEQDSLAEKAEQNNFSKKAYKYIKKFMNKYTILADVRDKNFAICKKILSEKLVEIDLNKRDKENFSVIDYLIRNNDQESNEFLKKLGKGGEYENLIMSPIEDYERLRLDILYGGRIKEDIDILLDSEKFYSNDIKFKLLLKSIISGDDNIITQMINRGFIDDITKTRKADYLLNFIEKICPKNKRKITETTYASLINQIKSTEKKLNKRELKIKDKEDEISDMECDDSMKDDLSKTYISNFSKNIEKIDIDELINLFDEKINLDDRDDKKSKLSKMQKIRENNHDRYSNYEERKEVSILKRTQAGGIKRKKITR